MAHFGKSKYSKIYNRYKSFCDKVNIVCKEGKDTIIMMDDNINSIDTNSLSNYSVNQDLKTLRDK